MVFTIFLCIFLFIYHSILQKILEHVITAVPASGLQVLQMATDLAHNLVMGSNELEAKESGHSAIEFLSKLCSIIASKVLRSIPFIRVI